MSDVKKEQGMPKTCERCGSYSGKVPEKEIPVSPLAGACALAEYIRCEHGTWGVRQLLTSLACLLPYDMIEQLACRFEVPAPPHPPEVPPPPVVPKQEKPAGMSPEQMLLMMNALGGGQKSGSGLDPAMLMQLLGK